MENKDNSLFPFLSQQESGESFDLWAITTDQVYQQRVDKIRWLSLKHIGHWLTYVVMYDYLHVAVVQYWLASGYSAAEIRRRVYKFFYKKHKSNVKVKSYGNEIIK
ncbi:MAG: hypothetical protein LBP59_10630 [Planctomycetaceae bacterium]|jgi:hypothetical protein|nr:hypothetical protein [Planctomycetaceae bacterium]